MAKIDITMLGGDGTEAMVERMCELLREQGHDAEPADSHNGGDADGIPDEAWERALAKLCAEQESQDAGEMAKAYRIESSAGVVLGIYKGADEYEAYEALCGDAHADAGEDMSGLTFEAISYRVRIGGSPPESAEEYDTAEAAVEGAMEMARGMCESIEDESDLDEWGSESDIGEGGWGVCPADDSGAYWPYIYYAD